VPIALQQHSQIDKESGVELVAVRDISKPDQRRTRQIEQRVALHHLHDISPTTNTNDIDQPALSKTQKWYSPASQIAE
jgi:hypothetical protein